MRNRLGVEATTVLVMDDDGLLTGRYDNSLFNSFYYQIVVVDILLFVRLLVM